MAEFKVNFGEPKTGKTKKFVVSEEQANTFLNKKIGDKIKGDDFGYPGYEFEITGGSDYCGFPMRKDVEGNTRKRILIVSGIGIRKNKAGRKVRKTVAGNTIYEKTAQINLKVLKIGKENVFKEKKKEVKPAEGEAVKEEKKAEEKPAEVTKEEVKETPKEEAKEEEKKEEKPSEKKK